MSVGLHEIARFRYRKHDGRVTGTDRTRSVSVTFPIRNPTFPQRKRDGNVPGTDRTRYVSVMFTVRFRRLRWKPSRNGGRKHDGYIAETHGVFNVFLTHERKQTGPYF